MIVIELQDATRVYKIGEMETHALRGVNLTIEDGEFTALVGPSGSGKTTVLQLMGCLDRPTSGRVLLRGEDVAKLSANKRADLRRGTIGFVFQFFALIPGLSAYENIELPLLLSGANGKRRKDRVAELLEAVGLSERAKHRPDQMSGGEQQRVAVARALATEPILILADDNRPEGSRTSAPELEAILSTAYDVTVWSTKDDGLPTEDDLSGYDAYIIDSGDYAFDMEEPDVPLFIALSSIQSGGVMLTGAQPVPGFDDNLEPIEDLVVVDTTHPVAEGFSRRFRLQTPKVDT